MIIRKLLGYMGLIFPPPLNKIFYMLSGVQFRDHKSTWIGVQVHIDNEYPALVEIGRNVTISFGSKIFAHIEPPETLRSEYFPCAQKKVVIGNNVFIGASSLILPGVIINDYVIIGAGSVVTKDVPKYSVVAGNPATFIRKLEKKEIPNESGV